MLKITDIKHLVHSRHSAFISSHLIHSERKHIFGKAHMPEFQISVKISLWSVPRKISLKVTLAYYPSCHYPARSASFHQAWQWVALSYFPKLNSLSANEDLTPKTILWRTCWDFGDIEKFQRPLYQDNITNHVHILLLKREQHTLGCHNYGMFIL